MKDLKLTASSMGFIFNQLKEMAMSGKAYRLTVKEWREKRSIPQNALQHSIYGDISKFLIANGRPDWTPEYTKMALKSKFLGWDSVDVVDIETGEVTTREVERKTSALDVGESCHYTTQIIDWAEGIGCQIRIPVNSDYYKYLQESGY